MPCWLILLASLNLPTSVAVEISLQVYLGWEFSDYLQLVALGTVLTHWQINSLVLCYKRSEHLYEGLYAVS
jgi:hypothetical protein